MTAARAMQLDRAGEPLREVAREIGPPVGPDLLIAVAACGVCRTDLHIFDGDLTEPKLPLVLGHQIVGSVRGVGERAERFAVGDRVWVRAPDGKTFEAPPAGPRDSTHLLVPFRRTGADLLAEWKALGVRDDVSSSTRFADRTVTIIGARAGERAVPQVWLDPQRGVVRFVTREKLPTGEGVIDVAFTEHRPLVGGFALPHRQEAYLDGKLVVRVLVRSAAVNSGLDDALFDPDALRRGR